MPVKLAEAGKLPALFAFELVDRAIGDKGNFMASHCGFMDLVTH
jgi:hypothetical protein